MAVGKESIKRAASAGTKAAAKTAEGTAAPKRTRARKTTTVEKEAVAVKEEAATKFMQEEAVKENKNKPVRVTEKMPVHLL